MLLTDSRIISPNEPTQTSGFPPHLALPRRATETLFKADSDISAHKASLSTDRASQESRLPTSPASPDLPEAHLHDFHDPAHRTESRLGASVPSSKMHSPPPSPRSRSSLLPSHDTGIANPYVPVDTPPASRRASSPEAPEREGLHVLKEMAVSASTSSPFNVNAPYIKPPLYIDYGTNLHIGATTFINRNFTVLDSPILRVTIGEGCLIGPNTTLASITHPLGKSCCLSHKPPAPQIEKPGRHSRLEVTNDGQGSTSLTVSQTQPSAQVPSALPASRVRSPSETIVGLAQAYRSLMG